MFLQQEEEEEVALVYQVVLLEAMAVKELSL